MARLGRPPIEDTLGEQLGIRITKRQAETYRKSVLKSLDTDDRVTTVEPDGKTLRVTGRLRTTGNLVTWLIHIGGRRERLEASNEA